MPLLHSAANFDQFWRFLELRALQDVVDIGANLVQSGVASNQVDDLGGDSFVRALQGYHELIQQCGFVLQGLEFSLQDAFPPLVAVFVDCAYRSGFIAVLARHNARALRFFCLNECL